MPSLISPVRTRQAFVFDSSLRTPVVYAIAVRYQTPMWRAGAMLLAGFWLLLSPAAHGRRTA